MTENVGVDAGGRMSATRAAGCVVVPLTLMALIGALVATAGWVARTDQFVLAWFVSHRSPVLDQLALAVTNAFGPAETAVAAVVVAVIAGCVLRSRRSGFVVIGTIGGASAACWLIKQVVARPRPAIALQETLETDYSFPSGHVTGAAALLGMCIAVTWLVGHVVMTRWVTAVAVTLFCAVSLSRMYLGVHWLTDVIAGTLLGCSAVLTGAVLLQRTARVTAEQPDTRHPAESVA
ncbi:phosphatase PAP2 family protein [Mycolicibacterium arenosum]|uniref:Phosphatase PAP2 family protein n=1 Tax=Mycolicibacterium arenosum TaxID=2952157 RepID=A0ABT1MBA8_9MYCO|nr:phosphatase PAP2 family protein [Mycolicibacterium sp. CAU 1645]MCP9276461.1 phosphatase PAP2 family protein [Mycolicibacterium sp. CAU 1645]